MGKKETNSQNHTCRIGEEFNKELEEIIELRLQMGVDKKRKSIRKLTNLIVRHRDWQNIRNDAIDIRLEGVKNER